MFVVLVGMLVAVLYLRPYAIDSEDTLEASSLTAACLIYSAILQGDRSTTLSTLVSVVYIVCKIRLVKQWSSFFSSSIETVPALPSVESEMELNPTFEMEEQYLNN